MLERILLPDGSSNSACVRAYSSCVSLSPCSWNRPSLCHVHELTSHFLSLSPSSSSSLLSGSLVGSAAAPAAQIIGGRAGVGGPSETHRLPLPARSEPSEWKISLGEPTVPPRDLVRQVRPSGFSWNLRFCDVSEMFHRCERVKRISCNSCQIWSLEMPLLRIKLVP